MITTAGSQFLKDGKPWAYVGVDCFPLLKRWLMRDGPRALVDPLLDEWRSLYPGDIVLRAFACAGDPNAFQIDPWSYPMSAITECTQHCNSKGFYVEWTRGDWSYLGLPQDGPRGSQEHLNQLCAALAPTKGNFVQTSNEPQQNARNRMDVSTVLPPPSAAVSPGSPWGTYLRNSGAYGDTARGLTDFHAVLDYVDYHPSRDSGVPSGWPKFTYDLPTTAAELKRVLPVPVIFGEPIGCSDTDRAGSRSCHPEHFRQIGSIVAYCAGVTFHCDAGINGTLLTPKQRECAEAFFDGVRAGW